MSVFGKLPGKEGPITKALRETLKLRKQLMADGTPEREADRICGEGLKAVLQHPNAEAQTFLCHKCRDSGMVYVEPSYEEKKRLIRLYGANPQYQPYMQACDPCRYRESEREKRRQQHGQEEGLVAAGRTDRRRTFR